MMPHLFDLGTLTRERYVFVDANHNGKADLSDTVNVIQETSWGLSTSSLQIPFAGWTAAKVISSRTLKDFLSSPPFADAGSACRDAYLSRFEDLAAGMPTSMDVSAVYAYLGATAFHCWQFQTSYANGHDQSRETLFDRFSRYQLNSGL